MDAGIAFRKAREGIERQMDLDVARCCIKERENWRWVALKAVSGMLLTSPIWRD
jgi:hypothetical protein